MAEELAVGILPAQIIERMVEAGAIGAAKRLDPDQIQPASLDLRLGEIAYRVRASFLPGPQSLVADRLTKLKLHEFSLAGGAVLETGCVYIIPLMEQPQAAARCQRRRQSEVLHRPPRHLHPHHHRPCARVRHDPRRLCRAALCRGQPAHLPDSGARRLAPVAGPLPHRRCAARRRGADRAPPQEQRWSTAPPTSRTASPSRSTSAARPRASSAIAPSATPASSTSTSAAHTPRSISGSRSRATGRRS